MKAVVFFLTLFIFVFICYLIFLFIKHKTRTLNKVNQYVFLEHKYQVDFQKLGITKTIFILAFCNSFIISNTAVIISYVKLKPVWRIPIAFVVLFLSIYLVYGITGKLLSKKK